MPYNKGDFTQQGIAGYVNGGLLLNNKRDVTTRISTDEESAGIDSVDIKIKDRLNDIEYHITGENLSEGENVIGGGGGGNNIPSCDVTLVHSGSDTVELYTDAFVGMLSLNVDNVIEDHKSYNIEPNESVTLKFGLINTNVPPAPGRVNMVGIGNTIRGVIFDTEDYSSVYTNLNNVNVIVSTGLGPGYLFTPVVIDITEPASCTLTMDFGNIQ